MKEKEVIILNNQSELEKITLEDLKLWIELIEHNKNNKIMEMIDSEKCGPDDGDNL